MKRYRDDGLEPAVRYGCDLFGCQLAYCKATINSPAASLEEIRKAKNEQAQRAAAEAVEQDRQQQLEKNDAAKKVAG